MDKIRIRKNDKKLKAFNQELITTLVDGKRYQVSGFGTFSICTRKSKDDRAACKMAMFRASSELRDYALGGTFPAVKGSHSDIVRTIIEAMQAEEGVNIPFLGRMAIVPVSGKNPKIIFHGSDELNKIFEESYIKVNQLMGIYNSC